MTNQLKLNKSSYFFKVLFTYILLYVSQSYAFAQRSITSTTSNWTLSPSLLIEAGTDYPSEFLSAANEVRLNVTVPLLLASGNVTVHQQSTSTWHENLKLSIKRTGNGDVSGLCVLCSIAGDQSSFFTISTNPINLVQIYAVASIAIYTNIPFQLKLTGVSVTIPAKTYTTNLVYTIGPI